MVYQKGIIFEYLLLNLTDNTEMKAEWGPVEVLELTGSSDQLPALPALASLTASILAQLQLLQPQTTFILHLCETWADWKIVR